jgi:hypothetical protein
LPKGFKTDYNTFMQEPLPGRTLYRRMLVSCGVLILVAGVVLSLTLIAAVVLILVGG